MSIILVPSNTPTYIAESSDISASKISGANIIGAKVYIIDTKTWFVLSSSLTLTPLMYNLNAKFGSDTDYSSFESDGTLVFTGSATVWEDLVVPLTTSKQGANTKPDFDYTNVGYLFPENDATEILYLIAQMPHSYKQGSAIYPHIHWLQTHSGSPVFKINYTWTNIGDLRSASAIFVMSTPENIYTSGSLHQMMVNDTGISGVGKNISSILAIKLYREDNGVYTGDALAYQFDIHYEQDTIGSRLEDSK